jgi:transcriptional regulator with XRE-family HTH domain
LNSNFGEVAGVMKKKDRAAAAPAKHPLQQLREILDWSRERFAKETGLKPATIQNIERGAAPLTDETAFAIESATSCNSMALMVSSEEWRRLKTEMPAHYEKSGVSSITIEHFMPRRLDLAPFTKQDYENYTKATLPVQNMDGAVRDLQLRIDLLLHPLAAEPHRFRSLYRYLVQVLNKARAERGPSNAEMNQYAATKGKVELKVMTVGELSKIPDVADSDAWKNSHAEERFGAKQNVHVVFEKYPFWPGSEVLENEEAYLAPDNVFGERSVWRITLPNGKPIGIVIDHTTAQGLQGRFTEIMVEINKEAAKGGK